MKSFLWFVVGSIVAFASNIALAQNALYTFEEVEEVANDRGRLLSPDRFWSSNGCLDLSTSPPTMLDDIGFPRPDGAISFSTFEGEARLLQAERLDDGGVRLTKVGCGEPELLFESTTRYHVAEPFPNSSRPLVLGHDDGISLLDLETGTPTLLWSADELHEALLGEISRMPYGANNARTIESVAVGVEVQALSSDTWLGIVSTAIQFEGLSRRVGVRWVVRFTAAGELDVIVAPDEGVDSAQIRTFPAWNAVWLGNFAYPIADLPADKLRRSSFPRDPALTAVLSEFRFAYLDSEGSLATAQSETPNSLLTYTGGFYFRKSDDADLDGDGARAVDEAARGSSDANPDSDGDGISDGTEVAIGTDPLQPDAQDADAIRAIGTTNLLQEWAPISPVEIVPEDERFRTGPFSAFAHPFLTYFPYLCSFTQGTIRNGWYGNCYDSTGALESEVDLRDGRLEFINDELAYNRDGIIRWRTGEVVNGDIDLQGFFGVSVTGDVINRPVATDHGSLVYHDIETWEGTQVQLGQGLAPYRVGWTIPLGPDPRTQMDLFSVDVVDPSFTESATSVIGVKDGEAKELVTLNWILSSAGIKRTPMMSLAEMVPFQSGYLLRIAGEMQQSIYIALDSKFRVTGRWNDLPSMALGTDWDLGKLGGQLYRHTVGISFNGSPDATCVSLDGVIACDAEPGRIARNLGEAEESITQQLIAFDSKGLGPDDALLADKGIWRYTPDGAIAEWLAESELSSFGLTEAVDFTIGERISAIAIRRDRRAVCFVRGERAYRMMLDEAGEIESISLEPDEDVVGCSWSMDGRLAIADGSGSFDVEGENVDTESRGGIRTFFSMPGDRWVTLSEQWEAKCIGPDGPIGGLGDVNGLAVFDDQLIYVISPDGRPYVLHVDDFCSEEAAMKRGDLYPEFMQGGLWTTLYFIANRSVNLGQVVRSGRSYIAPLSADHVLLLGVENEGTAFVGTAPPVPFRLRPGYRVGDEVSAVLGEPRFRVGTFSRAAERIFTSMATAPNASLRTTPTYYEEGTLAESPDVEEESDMEAPSGSGGDDGGGCNTAGSPSSLAALLVCILGLFFRRRLPAAPLK